MALSIPNRFVNGQTIDAAKFNANFDAIGSWATTTDATLTSDSSTIATHTTNIANLGKGAFMAYNTADQNILATTYTDVTLDDTLTDAFDTNSYFASNVYTPLVAGAYQFNVIVQVLNTGFADDETVQVFLTKNSTRYELCKLKGENARNGGASILLKANGSTDTFKVEVYASGAVTLNYKFFSGYCVKPD